ncbi:DUF4224 domain-containing protein [Caldimonas tepidiphila]|uniref:DUF4224 domain-containing protein n=1 Tax=Caldimonas tepidiphila TaxID=2315841 RepID=UPI000E5BF308|nr:DUF4224 domain-containing protein [Caldimonas tepidiphila]
MNTPTLTPAELHAVTGYRRADRQLAELHRQGFYRARRSPVTGAVILEREHYAAVCSGAARPATTPAPKLRTPQLRTA